MGWWEKWNLFLDIIAPISINMVARHFDAKYTVLQDI